MTDLFYFHGEISVYLSLQLKIPQNLFFCATEQQEQTKKCKVVNEKEQSLATVAPSILCFCRFMQHKHFDYG